MMVDAKSEQLHGGMTLKRHKNDQQRLLETDPAQTTRPNRAAIEPGPGKRERTMHYIGLPPRNGNVRPFAGHCVLSLAASLSSRSIRPTVRNACSRMIDACQET
jgi:hypothetical protein